MSIISTAGCGVFLHLVESPGAGRGSGPGRRRGRGLPAIRVSRPGTHPMRPGCLKRKCTFPGEGHRLESHGLDGSGGPHRIAPGGDE
jgi:hypothetical protein